MSKLIGFSLALGLLATPAFAEQPVRVVPDTSLSIPVGRSETLRFKSSFDSISVSNQGVVQASARTDRVLTLFGEAEGEAIVTVRSGPEEIYSVTVRITAEAGHTVKIYGHKNSDYVGYYCTSTACGRSDKELNGRREPQRTESTVNHRNLLPGLFRD